MALERGLQCRLTHRVQVVHLQTNGRYKLPVRVVCAKSDIMLSLRHHCLMCARFGWMQVHYVQTGGAAPKMLARAV